MESEPRVPKPKREIAWNTARARKVRELREDNGLCNRCGRVAPRDGMKTCLDCADYAREKYLTNRSKVCADTKKERKRLAKELGKPADIWRDNESRDGVKMREIVNPLRALRAIDSWMREC